MLRVESACVLHEAHTDGHQHKPVSAEAIPRASCQVAGGAENTFRCGNREVSCCSATCTDALLMHKTPCKGAEAGWEMSGQPLHHLHKPCHDSRRSKKTASAPAATRSTRRPPAAPRRSQSLAGLPTHPRCSGRCGTAPPRTRSPAPSRAPAAGPGSVQMLSKTRNLRRLPPERCQQCADCRIPGNCALTMSGLTCLYTLLARHAPRALRLRAPCARCNKHSDLQLVGMPHAH